MNALNYINGVFVNAVEGLTIPNINPSTGQQIGTLTRSNHMDVQTATEAASSAQRDWPA